MGQTRVDLRHLLEDLRDAYPGSVEETILTEVIANSLDSGAGSIRIRADTAAATLTVVDDGSGMRRRELARNHDLATSTKTRGKGIGFAGVGVKLGLLIGHEVVTESRTGATRLATTWSLTGRHKAPWHWLPAPPRLVGERGTAIRLHLRDPLSLLPEDRRGLAVCTYSKVIKRGWDWLGVSPAQADRIGGLIEAPKLAEWGDAHDPDERERRRAARPVERDLEDVLVNLADDFPMLATLGTGDPLRIATR